MLATADRELGDASGNELISAMMSLAYTSMLPAQALGGNMEGFRTSVEKLWALLPPDRTIRQ